MKSYSGIGSREAPKDVIVRAKEIAKSLANLGYVLRSGGASGTDSAFECGCDSVSGKKEIYLPEKNFNWHPSTLYVGNWPHEAQARVIAEECYGKSWKHISDWARKAHTRNIAQVLGWTLDDPVEFVICYTSNGKEKGGTAQAMRLAKSRNIPIYNLYYTQIEKFILFLD